jgi:predicted transcriptional regulator
MTKVKDYTEVSVPREVKKRVQILAARQRTSEDTAFEQLIRHGLEAYLAEQGAGADAAIGSLPAPPPDNKSGA